MVTFILRRILTGAAVLLVSTFIMYGMTDIAMNPFEDLDASTDPNKEFLIEQRRLDLNLDHPWYLRYWWWLTAFVQGDLGVAWRTGSAVSDVLGDAIVSTIQLVTASTFLAIFLGVGVGIISALRQYTTFDYLITFVSFVMYSLPSFWVAVLLKQWGAIGFNDFLSDADLPWTAIGIVAVVMGILVFLAIGGELRNRLVNGAVAALASGGLLYYLQASSWWTEPHLSGIVLALLSLGTGLAVVLLVTGLHNRRAMGTMLTIVVAGMVAYFPINDHLWPALTPDMSYLMLGGIILAAVVVGVVVGLAWMGPDKAQSMTIGGLTAGLIMVYIVVDRVMQAWPSYMNANAIRGRPLATIGGSTPNLGGNFWIGTIDTYTHLILPTLSLMLISFAAYSRYSRASMLEVMNQDYIRTARAKGLTERTVVMRHGFRNSLIPLGTIVPIDVITLVGGAIITEAIFARPGMGQLFVRSLNNAEPDPLMAYLVIIAALAVLANLVSDLLYAVLDPRIRVNA